MENTRSSSDPDSSSEGPLEDNKRDNSPSEKVRNSDSHFNPPSHSSTVSKSTISKSVRILKNRYAEDNPGPYDIHVQSISHPFALLHPVTVGRIMYRCNIENILEIRRAGYSKVSIYFKSREAANRLVDDQRLRDENLIAFVPPFCTSHKGIIRGVPIELSDQTILENIVSPIKVISVNRLNCRNITHFDILKTKNGQSVQPPAYVPSLSVCITVEGQKIPKCVKLFCISYPTSLYIPRVQLCHSCYSFGHVKISCRSKIRCVHCGEKDHSFSEDQCSQFQDLPRCANCKGNHRADSPLCPEFVIQREIREYATHRNLPLQEAEEIIRELPTELFNKQLMAGKVRPFNRSQ